MTVVPEHAPSRSQDPADPADRDVIRRVFTTAGRDAHDEVEWERRDARIINWRDGSVAFEQRDVEFPTGWSQNATNIVAQKYFRGQIGTGERESSLREVVDRIAGAITDSGRRLGYFVDDAEAETFRSELTFLLITQRAAFNSPVWFNIGVNGARQQASACFILSVDDDIDSILDWYREEGIIFKGGSGAGVNLSRLRASEERLAGGGTASGPVSFMRGADASAGTIKSGGTTRRAAKMVILDVDHPDIQHFIGAKAREERKIRALRDAGFDMDLDGADAFSVQYQNANNSVRVSDEFMQAVVDDGDWDLTARTTGEVMRTVRARDLWRQIAEAAWECADPGLQFDTTINRWHTAPTAGRITASNPCSEYFHLDDSACNLASLNLLKFLGEDGEFDIDGFRHAASILIVAQDILVDHADYPTEKIAEVTRSYRQLGLGFANLGASLMAIGLPYDSDEGRAWAAAVASLMAGAAYSASTDLASRVGPFSGFAADREAMLAVLEMHRRAAHEVATPNHSNAALIAAGQAEWARAIEQARTVGVRNSQAVVIAPTGTIGLAMDCDTTGIEPDLSLVKTKKLVGGGSMSIVNQTVPRALQRLGYDEHQRAAILDHIDATGSVLGAPGLAADHVAVFACSMGDNPIHHEGHVRMMAAVQPFVSGGISKTVNLPESATVEDVEQLHELAWRLGVKSIAIYRDNCKVGQPLSSGTRSPAASALDGVTSELVERVGRPIRRKLARSRRGRTFEFRVADCKGFATIGEYDDGQPGEIFLTVSKQGSTMAGIMDAFAKSISYGLQYGVPLRAFVEAFTNMRFEPAGMTDDPDIRFASSLMDYLFRRLALDYLTYDERVDLGIFSVDERLQPTLPGLDDAVEPSIHGDDVPTDPKSPADVTYDRSPSDVAHDAPMCMQCGIAMIRAGSCHACTSCGNTSGCS